MRDMEVPWSFPDLRPKLVSSYERGHGHGFFTFNGRSVKTGPFVPSPEF